MSNPQLPPPATSHASLAWLFLSFDGRIGREVYWLGIGLLWCILFVVVGLLVSVQGEEEATGMVLIIALASLWCELALLVKRQHDRGLPWYWCLLAFVPIVGVVWIVTAGILAGDSGPNAYGPEANVRPS